VTAVTHFVDYDFAVIRCSMVCTVQSWFLPFGNAC